MRTERGSTRADTMRSRRTRLLLMALPFIVLVFLFSYLPLYGWVYALFDYKPGIPLFQNPYVGLRFFASLFNSEVDLRETLRVVRNTFAISLLNLACTPLPILFAIFLMEIRSSPLKKIVQTTTTLPNFISWILVFSVFFSMLSIEDGFLNRVLLRLHLVTRPLDILGSPHNVWLFQTGVTVWKTLGWSAIIYLAAIAGIDPELYDAAHVDGAGRFRSIWHITVPGVLPTFFVILLLSASNIVNNGMEQYFMFQNPLTKDSIEVLDLYVYNQGIANIHYSSATAISVLKSLVSVVLLFLINRLSKVIRGYSII
jgi:putative aldouronate transport system permease protein